ncbi:MAG: hypothetical protein ABH870_08575 [bacterium]
MKILQFLQDEKGILSSTRLAFLIWAIGMFVVWAIVSIYNHKLMEIDNNMMFILLSLMTGKVVQKFGESKEGKKEPLKEIESTDTDTTSTVKG